MGNSCGGETIVTLKSHTTNGKHPRHNNDITALAISEDRSLIVSASDDCTMRLWPAQITPHDALGVLKGHHKTVSCIAIVRKYIFSGSHDYTIKKWDIETCECLETYTGHTSRVTGLVIPVPEKEFFFSVSYDTAKAWEMETFGKKNLCVGTFKDKVTRITKPILFLSTNKGKQILSSDILITGAADKTAKSWYAKEHIKIKTFSGHKGAISVMKTDDNHEMLFTGSFDRTIRSWYIHTGECLHVMEGHHGIITCLQVSVDHKNNILIYSGSSDGTARCWEANYGVLSNIFKGHTHTVHDVYLYGKILFTGCGDGVLRAFEADTGGLLAEGADHEAAISAMVVDDTKVFTGSHDNSVRVWDIRSLPNDTMNQMYLNESIIRKEEQMRMRQNENLRDLDEQLDEYYLSDDDSYYSRYSSRRSSIGRGPRRDSTGELSE